MGQDCYQPANEYTYLYGNANVNRHLRTGLFVHKTIISAVKRTEFVSGRMSYVTLRGHWCDVIVLNVQAPPEDKSDDTKNSSMRS
jgi:hypothetical protein